MKPRIATVTGTFLTPGVSKNGRLYTTENIGKAVARMTERLESGGQTITMRPFHPEDPRRFDATKVAGRVTKVTQSADGSGMYEAEIPDTEVGRDIVALTSATEGHQPFVRNVSIFGYWASDPHTVEVDGRMVETADDLEVDAIDFTPHPGVEGARISTVAAETALAAAGRTVITETFDATITPITEDDTAVAPGPKSPIVEVADRIITVTLTETDVPADAARLIAEALAPKTSPVTSTGAEQEKEPPVAEETKAAEAATALNESVAKAVTEALAVQAKAKADAKAAKKKAKAEAAAASTAAVTETATESKGLSEKKVNSIVEAAVTAAVTKAVAETKDAFRDEIAKGTGAPRRKGLIESAQKSLEKPPHEMSPEEWAQYRGEATALALTSAPERSWGDLAPAR